MTIWQPDLAGEGPRYRAIADQLARDIAGGQLAPGTRLPTHRALATQIGVTVGTVSRAYAEAERLGLVSGEVGRGTFVRGEALTAPAFEITDGERAGLIDLSRNIPDPTAATEPLRRALAHVAERAALGDLLDYAPSSGFLRHRESGAHWMERAGLAARPDEVVVTAGAQHALMVALAAVAKPGDVILCAELTYPGMTALARLLRLRLEGLGLDDEGICPDAFEEACRTLNPKALYCIPTNQNPTAAVMSDDRRRRIAQIAQRHDVLLIEDDICGFLPQAAPPALATFAPERSFYVTSLSKCIAGGLRIGFLRAPEAHAERVAVCVRTMMWMAPPLMAEVASIWIEDGTAGRLVEERRREAARRVALARAQFPGGELCAPPESYHAWLRLPDPWRAADFAREARVRGVGLSPAEVFAVGRAAAPHAVRLCLAAPRRVSDLRRALETTAELARSGPDVADATI